MATSAHNAAIVDALPADMRAKWEAHKNKTAKAHPLYQTASQDYGKTPRGVVAEYVVPVNGKSGGFSDTFAGGVGASGPRSTLDCSIAKHRYMKELDPM